MKLVPPLDRHPGESRGRAPESVYGQRGESPLQKHLQTEAEGNCVAVKRGEEQPEVNDPSVGIRTRYGRNRAESLRPKGEP